MPSLVILEQFLLAMTFLHTVHAVRPALEEKDREVEPQPRNYELKNAPDPKCPGGSVATAWEEYTSYGSWIGKHGQWLHHECEKCMKPGDTGIPSCYGIRNPVATTTCRDLHGCECYVMKGESIKTCAQYKTITHVYMKCCNGFLQCRPCEDAKKDCSEMAWDRQCQVEEKEPQYHRNLIRKGILALFAWGTAFNMVFIRSGLAEITDLVCEELARFQQAMTVNTCLKGLYRHGAAACACITYDLRVKKRLSGLCESLLKLDAVICTACIGTCAKAKQWPWSIEEFSHMMTAGLELDVVACGVVLSASSTCGRWEGASTLLATMREQTTEANVVNYNSSLSACEKAFSWVQSAEMFDRMAMVTVEADLITYSALANGVEAKGYWRTAVDIRSQLRERGLQADVVLGNTVISAMEKGNQWTVAISLLDQMSLSHLKTTEITVNSVISACEKGLQWKRAESLLYTRPSDCGSGQLRVAGDTFAYNSLMSAYEECGLWMQGLSALSLMSSKHVRADVVTFTSSIGACEWEHSYILLHVMPGRRIVPNVVAMSSAISSAEKGDQWELALSTLVLMLKLKVSPNDVSFNSAIIACARGGKWELALHILSQMLDLHLAPDLFTGTSTVWALETTGEWQQALDFLRCMPQTRAKPNVFGCASDVNICERQGDWQKGTRLIDILSQVAMLRI
ncbi:unnamed protein product [Symbiodinium sp. CCMP2592]|nr:unnamed protein product [Symbiodinium sp. CCMP2592]